jgi:magnesium transporter
MIKTMLVDKQSGETRCGGEGLLAGWADNESIWIWADFDREEPAREAELFSTHFGLDPLVIADAQNKRHPPKLEGFEDYFFLLLRGLDATTKDIEFGTIQIAMFVGECFLVTRRNALSVSTDKAWMEAEQGTLKVVRGPAHVAYRIIRLVTERYASIVVGLERRLDELEEEMFENPRDEILEVLVGCSANLKSYAEFLPTTKRCSLD